MLLSFAFCSIAPSSSVKGIETTSVRHFQQIPIEVKYTIAGFLSGANLVNFCNTERMNKNLSVFDTNSYLNLAQFDSIPPSIHRIHTGVTIIKLSTLLPSVKNIEKFAQAVLDAEEKANCPILTHLHFSPYIEVKPGMAYIEQESLGFDQLIDLGLTYIGKLTNLRYLSFLRYAALPDDSLDYVAKLIHLKSLNLSGCESISDSGMEKLVVLEKLQHLDVSRCDRIGDTGCIYIAKLRSLKHLNIRGCFRITNVGLSHIKQFINLK